MCRPPEEEGWPTVGLLVFRMNVKATFESILLDNVEMLKENSSSLDNLLWIQFLKQKSAVFV